jgi:hypothetical protein
VIEPKYVITRKTAEVHSRFEHFLRVVFGSRKVCEVWAPSGSLRKSYDKKGKLIKDAGASTTLAVSGPRFALAFLILRHAFDLKTALEWASLIDNKLKVPEDPSRYAFGVSVIVYTKAELFEMILEEQQRKAAQS